MTMVDKLLVGRGATAKGRPSSTINLDSIVQDNHIPRFGKQTEQMEQEGGAHTPNDRSSNTYQGTPNSQIRLESLDSPDDSSLSRAAQRGNTTRHEGNNESGARTSSNGHELQEHFEPPIPPNLTSRHSGQPFGISQNAVGCWEVIKLSIELPLCQDNSWNDTALFF